jgi:hypothetical protein
MLVEVLSVPLYHLSGLVWQTRGGDFDYNSGDLRLALRLWFWPTLRPGIQGDFGTQGVPACGFILMLDRDDVDKSLWSGNLRHSASSVGCATSKVEYD